MDEALPALAETANMPESIETAISKDTATHNLRFNMTKTPLLRYGKKVIFFTKTL